MKLNRVINKKDCLSIGSMGIFLILIPLVVLIILINDPFGWFKSEIAKNQLEPLPSPTLSIEPEHYYPLPAEMIYNGWEGASEGGICVEFNQELHAVSRSFNQKTPQPVNLDIDLYPYVKDAFFAFGYNFEEKGDCDSTIQIEVDGPASGSLYTLRTCYGAAVTIRFRLQDNENLSEFSTYSVDQPGIIISESECHGAERKLKKVFAETLYDGLSRLFSPNYFMPLSLG